MLLHPLFQTLLDEPELLADHAGAYAQLVTAEARVLRARLAKRWALLAAALAMVVVSVILGGVSVLLWQVAPASVTSESVLVFVVVPAAPAAVAFALWLVSRRYITEVEFPLTRQQLAMDRHLFQRRAAA